VTEPATARLAQRGSFPFWSPHKEVLKGSASFASGEIERHTSGSEFCLAERQSSIVTILYSASQDGQLKGIGSDLLIVQKGR